MAGKIENHAFYSCLCLPLWILKAAGAWVHRRQADTQGIYVYYAFKTYCIFSCLASCAALVRVGLILQGPLHFDSDGMYTIHVISTYIAAGVCQLSSYFKYGGLLPFWDDLLISLPQRFSDSLIYPKFFIRFLVSFILCFLVSMYAFAYYFILQPEPDSVFLQLAEPWTENITEARLSYMVTFACFLPALMICGMSGTVFLTSAFYLRWGFADIYKAMQSDLELEGQVALYRQQHLKLCELTARLDAMFKGYIGSGTSMATFNLCFVIYILKDCKTDFIFFGTLVMFYMSLVNIAIIAVLSISIISWVSTCIAINVCSYPNL